MHGLFCQSTVLSLLPRRSATTVCDYPHPVRYYLHSGDNGVDCHFFSDAKDSKFKHVFYEFLCARSSDRSYERK